MVEHDALAHPRGRMNIDAEDFGNAALQVAGQMNAVVVPQPMADTLACSARKPLK